MIRWGFTVILSCLLSNFCFADTKQALMEHARKMEQKYALPAGLLVAICTVESNWQVDALGAVGEIGLCQIKPNTVKIYCKECENKNLSIHVGMRSERVQVLQEKLKKLGYYHGLLDGAFGPATLTSVVQYQAGVGLKTDGIVGKETWISLFGWSPTEAAILEQLHDGPTNIELAAQYLVYLRRVLKTNEAYILAAAYNAGERGQSVRYMMKVLRKRRTDNNKIGDCCA